jgi:flavin reductase (DIM6/NTAB) family NADH-FMN oxidoreductase RutF
MEDDLADTFTQVVAQLDAPLVIVTTVAGGERAGCLVGFHGQCSIEPVRYVVWLSKANHTCRVALHAEHLVVHLLDRSQHDLAELFGGHSGDELDKFQRCRWTPGPGGVPELDDCPNRFVARRVALLDEGSDHVCVVVEPIAAHSDTPVTPLRLSDVGDVEPGHRNDERPMPPTERATTW